MGKVKITCTKDQKDDIIALLGNATSYFCVGNGVVCTMHNCDCEKCLNAEIEWTIEEDESDE